MDAGGATFGGSWVIIESVDCFLVGNPAQRSFKSSLIETPPDTELYRLVVPAAVNSFKHRRVTECTDYD